MPTQSKNTTDVSHLEQAFGSVEISLVKEEELEELIELYKSEDLDLRRLVPGAHESYPSLGKTAVESKWLTAIDEVKSWVNEGKLSENNLHAIIKQSEGIVHFQAIPLAGTYITDPFNMKIVEDKGDFNKLVSDQLAQIVVLRINNEIASSARVLDVEGSWEVVSIVTKKKYRGRGLASVVIQEILRRFPQRPLFSFQQLHVVGYYLRQYHNEHPSIPAFAELPPALQRDLFRMNIFWGPCTIIKISGNS